ncbi:MAG: hypothetical protein R3F37_19980 [Candidatus Competibacteraceae bacterium]
MPLDGFPRPTGLPPPHSRRPAVAAFVTDNRGYPGDSANAHENERRVPTTGGFSATSPIPGFAATQPLFNDGIDKNRATAGYFGGQLEQIALAG